MKLLLFKNYALNIVFENVENVARLKTLLILTLNVPLPGFPTGAGNMERGFFKI